MDGLRAEGLLAAREFSRSFDTRGPTALEGEGEQLAWPGMYHDLPEGDSMAFSSTGFSRKISPNSNLGEWRFWRVEF